MSSRKLVLLVDLDQTLIHTTHESVPGNIKDVHHFQVAFHKMTTFSVILINATKFLFVSVKWGKNSMVPHKNSSWNFKVFRKYQ